jgi:DNA-binding PadR family transcriptional regulator
MEMIEGNVLRGHLELMILAILFRGDAHGFEILRRLEQEGCGALRLKEGTLYPALYRLEEAGMIRAAWEDNAERRRGPRRRIYKLLPKGLGQLERGRAGWRNFVSVVGKIVEAT